MRVSLIRFEEKKIAIASKNVIKIPLLFVDFA